LAGWVDLPTPNASLELFADGVSIGSPALRDPSGEGTTGVLPMLRRRFELPLDLSGSVPGSLVMIRSRLKIPGFPARLARRDLPCVRRPPSVAHARLKGADESGYLDTVEAGMMGSPISASGWAFSARGVTELRLLVDGRELARTRQHGFRRDDVPYAFPDVDRTLAAESGFMATIDSSGLSAGTHQFSVEIIHPDGSGAPINGQRRFTLESTR
jgi:hypothetical protein